MKTVLFGELLLRLSAPGHTRLFQKESLDATFCGAEANVAVSLSIFGDNSVFVTKLPENDIGHSAARALDYFGVDTSHVVYGEGRMGLFYLEKGASQRSSKVIYDRANSSFSLSDAKEFDWDVIFENVDWFHWTGINPALSSRVSEICIEACRIAKDKGITISCDLNYRSKLWSTEQAQKTMKPLMKYVDVCICNEEDASKVLGIQNNETDIEKANLKDEDYIRMAEIISRRYGCKYVATTLRSSYSASINGWRGMLYDAEKNKSYFSRSYDIQIVDRVGGGDSFCAGIIHSLKNGVQCEDALEFATAASCLNHTIEGDFNRISVEEVEELIKNGGNGRVQR